MHPKWVYHFAFPLVMNECFYCPTSSPAFGVISVLDVGILIGVWWYLIVVLIFIFLMTYDFLFILNIPTALDVG